MSFSFCATGDAMLLERFPSDYNYESLAHFIGDCDARITNLEMVVSDWDCCASTYCGGQWINAPQDRLDDLSQFGFNLYSCANNHCMDYSYDGLKSTIESLQKRNVVFAGIGNSLDEASEAACIDCENATCALVSVTSTFIDAARAGNSRDGIPARPGLNPLRVKTRYVVSTQQMEALREIASVTYINGERDNARTIGSLPPEEPGTLNFGGHFFSVSENGESGKKTACDPRDLRRILETVETAKKKADFVIVSVHSHQIRRTSYTEPDFFLEEFAHACIDSGACAVVGGGTHQLKPIEIYKGFPIFYSLGNFIFESGMISRLPADYWDKYGFPESLTVAEAQSRKTKNGTIGLETDIDNYYSVLPKVTFSDSGVLESVELLPIYLGFDRERAHKGLPVPASEEISEQIVRKLVDMSAEYGTVFDIADRLTVVV